jgi:arylsulfatase A-like enzyme
MVLIVSDALRYDMLGCNGGPAETPNIDWLAANGVVFDRAHAPSPWTLPSGVAMFTGNHASTYPGVFDDKQYIRFSIPPTEKLFGVVLRDAGFLTHCQVENYLPRLTKNFRGFAPFPAVGRDQIRRVREETGFSGRNSDYRKDIGLLHFLLTVPENSRFFALKWILDPHSPHNPPKIFRDRIPIVRFSLPRDVETYTRSHLGQKEDGGGRLTLKDLSADELGFFKALYAREVESMDERVGYMLAALRKNGRMGRTYIVFTSDHGESFGEHNRLGHGHSYSEELLHVPLIICGPGLPQGRRIHDRVTLLGLMPTIMDLLGIPFGETVQGRSFAPLLRGEKWEPRSCFHMGAVRQYDQKDALVDGDYKLIAHKQKDKFSLFHLPSDPGEMKNLAGEERQRVKRMRPELIRIRRENMEKLRGTTERNRWFKKLPNLDQKRILKKLRSLGYID